MMIRAELEKDYDEVNEVITHAFASAEQSDGSEKDLVVALRKSAAFIPELSLVVEQNGKIVGHILFTKINIGNCIELALAPLAVLPEYQRLGIGLALIREGHKIAEEMGFHFSVVLGSEVYYSKAGYVSASSYGIAASFDVPDENFMAYKLCKEEFEICGTVKYALEFGIE